MSDADGDYEPSGERWPVDEDDYGLDSDEGNVRMQQVVADLVAQAERGEVERREAVVLLADALEEMSGDHPEVTDITVRSRLVAVLDPVFTAQGWERLGPFEF
ncbi:MAG: hypothetical protein ACJ74O_07010 [Frankiaceae bacterium]